MDAIDCAKPAFYYASHVFERNTYNSFGRDLRSFSFRVLCTNILGRQQRRKECAFFSVPHRNKLIKSSVTLYEESLS